MWRATARAALGDVTLQYHGVFRRWPEGCTVQPGAPGVLPWPGAVVGRCVRTRRARKGNDMPTQILVLLFVAGVLGLAAVALLGATFFTVEQRTAAVVQ